MSVQTDGSYQHEYVLRDHLGNTRVTFSDANNDGVVGSTDIKQINSYYPFGLNMESNFNGAAGKNKYAYNGKEWNDDFGLGWNDYGARFYDHSRQVKDFINSRGLILKDLSGNFFLSLIPFSINL